jgi:DNA-binding CsgD family transcriptional regulator
MEVVGSLNQVLGARVGLSPVMVGRSAAYAQLRSLMPTTSVTVADLPTVALVAGEAGVGKTRLLRELVADLPSGITVLSGAADPDALGRPYSLAAAVLPGPPAGFTDPDAVVARFAERIGDEPAVVIFEDLHWADAESATVIDRLAQLPCPRLLLIGTYRPDDLSRRLPGGDLLLRLERRHAVEQVRLERLDRNDVGALVAAIYSSPPSSAVIEAVSTRSGGNPFLIEEIVAATGCREGSPSDLLAARLPWSLEEAVRSQLEGLTTPERRVLEAAAVCGPTTRFEALARAADMPEDALLEVLRRLVDANLLVEADDDRFSFRHALVSDEVERQLLGRERRLLHERALEGLRSSGGDDLAAMARHAAGAGRFEEFVTLSRDAAQHYLAQGSTFQSLRLAADALSEAPDDPELLAVAAESAWLVSLYAEALGYTDRWLATAREHGDIEEEAAALRWRLRLHHEMRRPDAIIVERALLEELIGRLPSCERRARAMASMAQSLMLQDQTAEAIVWADRAIEEGERVGARSVVVQARVERGSALVHVDRANDAELRAAVEAAEAEGEWVLVTRGLNNLFEAIPVFTPEGRVVVDRFRRAAGRAGFDSMSHAISAFREAEIASSEGDLAATRRAMERGAEWCLRCQQDAAWLIPLEFDLAFEEGRAADARTALERLALYAEPGHASWWARTELELAWLDSDPTAVLRWADRYLTADIPDNLFVLTDVINVVDLALDAGVDARHLGDGLSAALAGHPSRDRIWTTVEGLLHAAAGRPVEAITALDAVLADPDPTIQRHVLGHLRVRLAQCRLAAGERTRAMTEVRRALDELSRWPGWRRDRALALRGRLDGGGAAPEGELTQREREVAALLTEGLTNSELARRLFISPKTAAVHVSNILMKLHMASRAEVAAWAVRTGLADDVQGRAS